MMSQSNESSSHFSVDGPTFSVFGVRNVTDSHNSKCHANGRGCGDSLEAATLTKPTIVDQHSTEKRHQQKRNPQSQKTDSKTKDQPSIDWWSVFKIDEEEDAEYLLPKGCRLAVVNGTMVKKVRRKKKKSGKEKEKRDDKRCTRRTHRQKSKDKPFEPYGLEGDGPNYSHPAVGCDKKQHRHPRKNPAQIRHEAKTGGKRRPVEDRDLILCKDAHCDNPYHYHVIRAKKWKKVEVITEEKENDRQRELGEEDARRQALELMFPDEFDADEPFLPFGEVNAERKIACNLPPAEDNEEKKVIMIAGERIEPKPKRIRRKKPVRKVLHKLVLPDPDGREEEAITLEVYRPPDPVLLEVEEGQAPIPPQEEKEEKVDEVPLVVDIVEEYEDVDNAPLVLDDVPVAPELPPVEPPEDPPLEQPPELEDDHSSEAGSDSDDGSDSSDGDDPESGGDEPPIPEENDPPDLDPPVEPPPNPLPDPPPPNPPPPPPPPVNPDPPIEQVMEDDPPEDRPPDPPLPPIPQAPPLPHMGGDPIQPPDFTTRAVNLNVSSAISKVRLTAPSTWRNILAWIGKIQYPDEEMAEVKSRRGTFIAGMPFNRRAAKLHIGNPLPGVIRVDIFVTLYERIGGWDENVYAQGANANNFAVFHNAVLKGVAGANLFQARDPEIFTYTLLYFVQRFSFKDIIKHVLPVTNSLHLN